MSSASTPWARRQTVTILRLFFCSHHGRVPPGRDTRKGQEAAVGGSHGREGTKEGGAKGRAAAGSECVILSATVSELYIQT